MARRYLATEPLETCGVASFNSNAFSTSAFSTSAFDFGVVSVYRVYFGRGVVNGAGARVVIW